MSQHFLQSSEAKTLCLTKVFRMSDAEAEATFRKLRWPETNGGPVCPRSGGLNAYECRRPNGALRSRCKACKADFTITSGTLFAFHKLPLARAVFRLNQTSVVIASEAWRSRDRDPCRLARQASLRML